MICKSLELIPSSLNNYPSFFIKVVLFSYQLEEHNSLITSKEKEAEKEKEKKTTSRRRTSTRRSTRMNPVVKVLTSATFIRGVLGVLKKVIR